MLTILGQLHDRSSHKTLPTSSKTMLGTDDTYTSNSQYSMSQGNHSSPMDEISLGKSYGSTMCPFDEDVESGARGEMS